jgi:DNA-directed RNA polymerase subunit RPC12/RpoP
MIEERIEERIKCPYCSEQILVDAVKCRFCGEWFKEKNKPDVKSDITVLRPSIDISEKKSAPELQETVKEPQQAPVKRPAEKARTIPYRLKRRTSWLRILLTIVYAGIITAFVFYERQAHEVLHSGQALENLERNQEAQQKYEEITGKYWLSFAEIDARKGLFRINPDNKPRVNDVYLLPLVAWPLCTVLLLLVFISRILRPGMAFLAFLLFLLGIAGSVFQFAWYGLISFEPIVTIVQEFVAEPKGIFVVSYLMLIITALMSLTATRKFPLGS